MERRAFFRSAVVAAIGFGLADFAAASSLATATKDLGFQRFDYLVTARVQASPGVGRCTWVREKKGYRRCHKNSNGHLECHWVDVWRSVEHCVPDAKAMNSSPQSSRAVHQKNNLDRFDLGPTFVTPDTTTSSRMTSRGAGAKSGTKSGFKSTAPQLDVVSTKPAAGSTTPAAGSGPSGGIGANVPHNIK